MKGKKLILRILILVVIGIVLSKMTYQFQFRVFFVDVLIYFVLGLIGVVFLIWFLIIDLILFKKQKQWKYLVTSFFGVLFMWIILILYWETAFNFNKPTLLKVCYDGDINGTIIDFKTDGTYVFDNFAIGIDDYSIGKYQIEGNRILLDRSEIENVIKSSVLLISEEEIANRNEIKKEQIMSQINGNGVELKNEIEFRVVVDNRNK